MGAHAWGDPAINTHTCIYTLHRHVNSEKVAPLAGVGDLALGCAIPHLCPSTTTLHVCSWTSQGLKLKIVLVVWLAPVLVHQVVSYLAWASREN